MKNTENNNHDSNKRFEVSQRRQRYRDLIDQTHTINDKIETSDMLDTINGIYEIVKTSEELLSSFKKDKVDNTTDYLIDAQVLKMSHDIIGSASQKLGSTEFCENEYATVLLQTITTTSENDNFNTIFQEALKCCKTSRGTLNMLGTFDLETPPQPPEPKKVRQSRAKTVLSQLRGPEKLKNLESNDTSEAEKTVQIHEEVKRICDERSTDLISHSEFVANQDDFMKSVHNANYVSHLVKADILGLKRQKDDIIIQLCESNDKKVCHPLPGNDISKVNHLLLTYTPKTWRNSVKRFSLATRMERDNSSDDD